VLSAAAAAFSLLLLHPKHLNAFAKMLRENFYQLSGDKKKVLKIIVFSNTFSGKTNWM
jgi:hypothetical protein